MRTYICLLFITLGVLPWQPGQAENLLQVYDAAVEHDNTLRTAGLDQDIAKEKYRNVAAAFQPTVDLSAESSVANKDSSNHDNDLGTSAALNYELTLRKPLRNPVEDINRERAANELEATDNLYRTTRQKLLLKVVNAYFGFLNAGHDLHLGKQQLANQTEELHLLEEQYQQQNATVTDLYELRAYHDQLRIRVLEAEDKLEQQQMLLHYLTGQNYPLLDDIQPDTFAALAPEQDADYWITAASRTNGDIQDAKYRIRSAKAALDATKAGTQAKLDLLLQHSGNSLHQTHANQNGFDNRVGLEWNVPLYDGDRSDADIRQAKLELDKAQVALETSEATVKQQVEEGVRKLHGDYQRIHLYQQMLASSREVLTTTRQGHQLGSRTMTDVLQAQEKVLQAERNYREIQYAYLLNWFELRQLAGVADQEILESLALGKQQPD